MVIDNKIQDISFSINHWDLVQSFNKKTEFDKLEKRINRKRKNNIKNERSILNNNKRKNNFLNNINNINRNEGTKEIKLSSREKNSLRKNKVYKSNPHKKKTKETNLNFNNKNHGNKRTIGNSRKNKNINKQEIIIKSRSIMEFNDEELNNLSYELALKYDQRKYCGYYISLLKTKHIILFSFCYNQDYNSKIVKINLFFICFIIDYTINALFFNDDTMHKIYEDEGAFNFIYQLPQIIYSSLISIVLNIPLKFLALSERDILDLKKNKEKNKLQERITKLNNKLNIKIFLYFALGFIFLLCFWYYLSMFGAVYKNTQYYLIKDTLISFGLSLVYPFGINLIPGIFRIPALSNIKNNKYYLYKFSKFLQMI